MKTEATISNKNDNLTLIQPFTDSMSIHNAPERCRYSGFIFLVLIQKW